tara:strand:- start:46 stop:1041 length:996 start_codon:yes stop_codon:yes gene_type:complete
MSVEKLNTIAVTSIEKVNSKTDANIESINGITFAGYSALTWTNDDDFGEARQQSTSAGTAGAAFVMGGYNGSSQLATTKYHDGSSWAAKASMSGARDSSGGTGTFALAMDCGGYISGDESQTTELYNGTTNVWSTASGNNMQVGSYGPTVFGSRASAMWCGGKKFGGDAATFITNSESWDTTSWTAEAALSTGIEGNAGGAGTAAAGLVFGGNISGPAHTDKTQVWNGSSWSGGNDMNTARRYNSGFGTSTRAWTQGGTSAHGSSYITLNTTETFDGTSWASDTNLNTNVGLQSHGCHVGSARTGFVVGGLERDATDGTGQALIQTYQRAS